MHFLSLVGVLALVGYAQGYRARSTDSHSIFNRRQSGTVKFPDVCLQECGPVQTAANCGNNQCGCNAEVAATLDACEACLLEIVRHQNAENAINAIGDSNTPQVITPSMSVPTVAQYEAECAGYGFPIPGSTQAGKSTSSTGGGKTNTGSGQSQPDTPGVSGAASGQSTPGQDSSSAKLSSASEQGKNTSGSKSIVQNGKLVTSIVILSTMYFMCP